MITLKKFFSKKKTILVGVFLFCLTFVLRLPTIFKPFDLAYEYQLAYFGREAFVGQGFYGSPWSMKGPGETFVYGLTYLLFGHQSWDLSVRMVTATLAGLAAFFIYLISKRLYGVGAGLFVALFFALFFSRNLAFAGTLSYAEMLMPFFTILGVFFFLEAQKTKSQRTLFLAGLSFGLSLFFKQSAIYDFLPFLICGMGRSFLKTKKILPVFKEYLFFIIGFLTPLGIFVGYIFLIGRFPRLWDWLVVKPSLYAKLREKEVLAYLKSIFKNTYFVWITAFFSIYSALLLGDKKRWFFIIWFFFTYMTFVSSGKLWNYYFIQPFLPACFLAGGLIADLSRIRNKKMIYLFLTGGFCFLILVNFPLYLESYRKFWPVLQGKLDKESYIFSLSEGESWTNLYKSAQFLKQRLKTEDKLLVMEGTPSTYILVDRMSPYPDYIFEQQFFENKSIGFAFNHRSQKVDENRQDLGQKLVREPPSYLVLVFGSVEDAIQKVVSFPWLFAFIAQNYSYLNNFGHVWVYYHQGKISLPQSLILEPHFAQEYKISVVKE